MPSSSTTYNDPTTGTSDPTGKVSEVASQIKDKVSDFSRTAVDTIDANRDAAASGMETAAQALHQNAESLPGGEKVTSIAHSAAGKLSSTAQYVREHDVKSMIADVEQLVKNNPAPALLAAAVIGFLVGRGFRSNN